MNPVVQHHFLYVYVGNTFSVLAAFLDRFSLNDEKKATEIPGEKGKTKACPLGYSDHILRLVSLVPGWFHNCLCIQFCNQGRCSSLHHHHMSLPASGVSSTKVHNLRLKELQLLREK